MKILVKVEQTEYLNLDNILIDLKLTPESLEIPIPRYFVEERTKELEERERLLVASVDILVKIFRRH